jgi:hypothetical protein
LVARPSLAETSTFKLAWTITNPRINHCVSLSHNQWRTFPHTIRSLLQLFPLEACDSMGVTIRWDNLPIDLRTHSLALVPSPCTSPLVTLVHWISGSACFQVAQFIKKPTDFGHRCSTWSQPDPDELAPCTSRMVWCERWLYWRIP